MMQSCTLLKRVKVTQTRSIKTNATALSVDSCTFRTGTNVTFAPIINGCWQLAGGHGREVFDNIQDKLCAHADAGLTTFDTADIYGPSERILGEFLASRREAGKSPGQIFTKYVPNIYNGVPKPSDVKAAVQKSMANLQVDALDLVQLHWWEYGIPGMVDVALALAELREEGLVREVGLTNLDTAAVASIVDAGVPVVSNQVQFSLLDRRPLNGLVQYCSSQGIKLFTYGSLAGGLLSDKFVEEPKTGLFGQKKYSSVDLNTSSLKMYWGSAKRAGGQDSWRQLLGILRRIADKHKSSVSNVALRWVMQQGGGGLVHPIVGLRGTAHIQDNLSALGLVLDEDDMAVIGEFLEGCPKPQGDVYSHERGAV